MRRSRLADCARRRSRCPARPTAIASMHERHQVRARAVPADRVTGAANIVHVAQARCCRHVDAPDQRRLDVDAHDLEPARGERPQSRPRSAASPRRAAPRAAQPPSHPSRPGSLATCVDARTRGLARLEQQPPRQLKCSGTPPRNHIYMLDDEHSAYGHVVSEWRRSSHSRWPRTLRRAPGRDMRRARRDPRRRSRSCETAASRTRRFARRY